jgi:hypothetical protein
MLSGIFQTEKISLKIPLASIFDVQNFYHKKRNITPYIILAVAVKFSILLQKHKKKVHYV